MKKISHMNEEQTTFEELILSGFKSFNSFSIMTNISNGIKLSRMWCYFLFC